MRRRAFMSPHHYLAKHVSPYTQKQQHSRKVGAARHRPALNSRRRAWRAVHIPSEKTAQTCYAKSGRGVPRCQSAAVTRGRR